MLTFETPRVVRHESIPHHDAQGLASGARVSLEHARPAHGIEHYVGTVVRYYGATLDRYTMSDGTVREYVHHSADVVTDGGMALEYRRAPIRSLRPLPAGH